MTMPTIETTHLCAERSSIVDSSPKPAFWNNRKVLLLVGSGLSATGDLLMIIYPPAARLEGVSVLPSKIVNIGCPTILFVGAVFETWLLTQERTLNVLPLSSRWQDRVEVQPASIETVALSPHLKDLVDKQSIHLKKLHELAKSGGWVHLREHTSHPDSGFDWWMFPVDRPSQSYGNRFVIDAKDAKILQNNPCFIKNYRDGVVLVAKSWGWDLETHRSVKTAYQKWTGYQVRLGKMLGSLTLLGQDDLKKSLVAFLRKEGIIPSLQPWIQTLL